MDTEAEKCRASGAGLPSFPSVGDLRGGPHLVGVAVLLLGA